MTTDSLIDKLEAKWKPPGIGVGSPLVRLDEVITIIRQHEADHCEDVLHMVKTSESSLIGLLEPIADCDWHGKWRIQKAIAMLRQQEVDMGEPLKVGTPPTRGAEACGAEGTPIPSPANLRQGEISDDANEALTAHISESGFKGEDFHDYKTGFFDGYSVAKMKPVSLQQVVDAMPDGIHHEPYHDIAKAVLDAAGVKCAD